MLSIDDFLYANFFQTYNLAHMKRLTIYIYSLLIPNPTLHKVPLRTLLMAAPCRYWWILAAVVVIVLIIVLFVVIVVLQQTAASS